MLYAILTRAVAVMLITLCVSGCVSSRVQTEPKVLEVSDIKRLSANNKVYFVQKTGHRMDMKSFDIKSDTIYYTREVLWQDKEKKIATDRIKYLVIESTQLDKKKRQNSGLLGAGIGISLGLAWHISASSKECQTDACVVEAIEYHASRTSIPVFGILGGLFGSIGSRKITTRYEVQLDETTKDVSFREKR